MENKVKVRIYGQEYTISGEKKNAEIEKIAQYVDEKMQLICKLSNESGAGNVALLTAINIAEEYFDAVDKAEDAQASLKRIEEKSGAERDKYLKLEEEFNRYKEESAHMRDGQKESDARYAELVDKCSEYENSFFDLQMENIKLKAELDKLQKKE